jgi:hypothetical protein
MPWLTMKRRRLERLESGDIHHLRLHKTPKLGVHETGCSSQRLLKLLEGVTVGRNFTYGNRSHVYAEFLHKTACLMIGSFL